MGWGGYNEACGWVGVVGEIENERREKSAQCDGEEHIVAWSVVTEGHREHWTKTIL